MNWKDELRNNLNDKKDIEYKWIESDIENAMEGSMYYCQYDECVYVLIGSAWVVVSQMMGLYNDELG